MNFHSITDIIIELKKSINLLIFPLVHGVWVDDAHLATHHKLTLHIQTNEHQCCKVVCDVV